MLVVKVSLLSLHVSVYWMQTCWLFVYWLISAEKRIKTDVELCHLLWVWKLFNVCLSYFPLTTERHNFVPFCSLFSWRKRHREKNVRFWCFHVERRWQILSVLYFLRKNVTIDQLWPKLPSTVHDITAEVPKLYKRRINFVFLLCLSEFLLLFFWTLIFKI